MEPGDLPLSRVDEGDDSKKQVFLAADLLNEACEYLCMRDVLNCLLVCKQWYCTFQADQIWTTLARRHFPCLPLLRLTQGVERRHKAKGPQPLSSFYDKTLRAEYMRRRFERVVYKLDLRMQQEVRLIHPYVLHALLTIMWSTSVVFIAMLLCILEDFCPATMDQAFGVLHTAYIALFLSLLFNVIAVTHYEPSDFFTRVMKHQQLISTTGASLFVVIVFFFVTRIFQYNVTSTPEDRMPWILCFLPLLSMLAFWQLLAALAARPTLLSWLHKPYMPSLIEVHVILTNVFPSFLAIAVSSLAHYIETGLVRYLVFASLPFLFGTMSVTATFALDYLSSGKIGDAVASFSMANLSLFPIGFMIFQPRGFHLIPLLLFTCSFVVSYVRQWVKKHEKSRILRKNAYGVARMT
ncbi:hypothetical protein DIPPA_34269 [Diplonema papillatum]|nr:hypothetical protein DIPPA_34269 [Diplonema papillatum]